ncbi:MAG: hypothetical protein IPF63_14115 [Bacteroidetes bacterium]|nr:hypothetical protein [Bacteroidota bacterium]
MKVKHGSKDRLLLFKLVANAFGCTFAFLPTLKPKQKMQKSHQANAPKQTRNDDKTDDRKRRAKA